MKLEDFTIQFSLANTVELMLCAGADRKKNTTLFKHVSCFTKPLHCFQISAITGEDEHK